MLAAAGLLAGAPAGLLATGSLFATRPAAAATGAPRAETPPTAVTHAIENLMLNPAESGGRRFLVVTATFELKDASAEETMKDHEAEVRDRILEVLGRKTVDELSDITKREDIKTEVLGAVAPLFAKGSVLQVFFPQFVIQ